MAAVLYEEGSNGVGREGKKARNTDNKSCFHLLHFSVDEARHASRVIISIDKMNS